MSARKAFFTPNTITLSPNSAVLTANRMAEWLFVPNYDPSTSMETAVESNHVRVLFIKLDMDGLICKYFVEESAQEMC